MEFHKTVIFIVLILNVSLKSQETIQNLSDLKEIGRNFYVRRDQIEDYKENKKMVTRLIDFYYKVSSIDPRLVSKEILRYHTTIEYIELMDLQYNSKKNEKWKTYLGYLDDWVFDINKCSEKSIKEYKFCNLRDSQYFLRKGEDVCYIDLSNARHLGLYNIYCYEKVDLYRSFIFTFIYKKDKSNFFLTRPVELEYDETPWVNRSYQNEIRFDEQMKK
jgi:hypothetical protein